MDRKVLIMLLLTVIISACGGGESGSPSSPTEQPASDGITDRAWRLCNSFNNTSTLFSYDFAGDEYSYSTSTYTTNDCSGAAITFEELHAGTFTIRDTVMTAAGFDAVEIDFHIERAFSSNLPPQAQYNLYDIFFINEQGDILYFSDSSSFTEQDRPNEINLNQMYLLLQ